MLYYWSCSKLRCKKKRLDRIVQPLKRIVNLFFVRFRLVAQARADIEPVTGEAAGREIRIKTVECVAGFRRDVRVELVSEGRASEENLVNRIADINRARITV